MYWERCFIVPAAISACDMMGRGTIKHLVLRQKIDIFPQFSLSFLFLKIIIKKTQDDATQRLRLPPGISDAFFTYTFALQKKKNSRKSKTKEVQPISQTTLL